MFFFLLTICSLYAQLKNYRTCDNFVHKVATLAWTVFFTFGKEMDKKKKKKKTSCIQQQQFMLALMSVSVRVLLLVYSQL